MKPSDFLNSSFLKQSDFSEEPTRCEIVKWEDLDVARPGEKPEIKLCLYFRNYERPMVINSTNLKRCIKAFGDDFAAWPGRELDVYVDPDVEYAGQIVGGLRVKCLPRKTAPKKKAAGSAATEPGSATAGLVAMPDQKPWEEE